MANSSVTLQSVVDTARAMPDLSPQLSVGGMSQQPALSIANHVIMDMVSPTMNWKWNRMLCPVFYTNSMQQDYAVPGVVNLGWIESAYLIDVNNTATPKPLWPMESVRDLSPTSWMYGRVGQVSWINNSLLLYGTWAASSTYTAILGTSANPGTALTQIQDPNGNYWVLSNNLTTTVKTGTVQPSWPATGAITYPTPANPTQAATTVTDNAGGGTAVWTAVNPSGQGFRVFPLPPINGLYFEIHVIGQMRPPRFTTMSQTLEPIPDDYSDHFEHGFIAHAYRYSKDPKIRAKFADEFKLWMDSMAEAQRKAGREKEEAGFYPAEGILQGGMAPWTGPASPYFPGGF